jgi:prepilin-type N-terminal cleavage/methylation domain-containing protein
MKCNIRSAFTLMEVLIVVVILAVLAATIIPQFADSTKDAKESTLHYNLLSLRSQIQVYRTDHDGNLPGADLVELTKRTNKMGATTGTDLAFGPYIMEIPVNPFTKSAAVKTTASSPPTIGDVTATDGWLYNTTTGEIWINHADYYTD